MNNPDIEYKVTKTVLGQIRVRYKCPGCKVALNNPLSEAGKIDTCPDCARDFRVPGMPEKLQMGLKAEATAVEKAERKAEREREREERKEAARLEIEQRRTFVERVATQPVAERTHGRKHSDTAYFLFPPTLWEEGKGGAYHNSRFPALSLVVRAGVNASVAIYYLVTAVLILCGLGAFVALLGVSSENFDIAFPKFLIQMFALFCAYILNCWFAVARMAFADFFRTQMLIEDNTRKEKQSE